MEKPNRCYRYLGAKVRTANPTLTEKIESNAAFAPSPPLGEKVGAGWGERGLMALVSIRLVIGAFYGSATLNFAANSVGRSPTILKGDRPFFNQASAVRLERDISLIFL